MGFWGHIVCWELCRGPHKIFDLEINTSLGNDLRNVPRSEVDLQKRKRSYLSSVFTLIFWLNLYACIKVNVSGYKLKAIKPKNCNKIYPNTVIDLK